MKPVLRLGRVQHNQETLFGIRFTLWQNCKPFVMFWTPGPNEKLFRVQHNSDKYKVLGQYRSRIFESTSYLQQFWDSPEVQQTLSFWRVADEVLDPAD